MGILQYGVAWFLFAIVHSLLARPFIQHYFENTLGRCYRLFYNLLSVLCIFLVLSAGRQWLGNSSLAAFDNSVFVFASNTIQVMGLLLFLVALTFYDVGRFAGITQIVTGEKLSVSSNEPLQIQGLNRWVRHPLYTGAFLMLWGGAFSMFELWTAIWGTFYLLIGTYFEERKLHKIYGDEYLRYKQLVPRYFPRW